MAEESGLVQAAERFALTMTQFGLQRMTARVMSALLFASQETITAGEISEQLKVSSGAVSGAIKNLIMTGMIERVPAPGSRREHFRFRDDAWATLMSSQNAVIQAMTSAADESLHLVDQDTSTARRLIEMRDFYTYMLTEMPAMVERWHQKRAQS